MASVVERLKFLSLYHEVSADVLDCSACLETCKVPSSRCRKGHLLCGSCRETELLCPICGDSNLTESKILRSYRSDCIFACVHKEYGCEVRLDGINMNDHEKSCLHTPTRCFVESCNLLIARGDFSYHIKKYHEGFDDSIYTNSDQIEINASEMEVMNGQSKKYVFWYKKRSYIVNIYLNTSPNALCIWAQAQNTKIQIPKNLRVVFVVENARTGSSVTSELKTVINSQGFSEASLFAIPNTRHKYLGVDSLVNVNFKEISEDPMYVSGCAHYKRHCKLKCPLPECGKIVSCRECHDLKIKTHQFNRFAVTTVICCLCGKSQSPSKNCKRCQKQFAQYFCSKCNLYDDESTSADIFHCDFCRLCRRKESRDIEYYHCGSCDICLPTSVRNTHECKYNASKENCSVCSKEMHSSRSPIVTLNCGHYVHKTCSGQEGQVELRCRRC